MKKFLAMLLSAALLCPAMAMAEDTIKIGIFEPMTGATAAGGSMEKEGFDLANELYPDVLGKKIELVYGDNKSDRAEATLAAQSLVDKGVVAVLGSYGSGLSMAGGEVFAENEIPALTATATNPTITLDCEWYARICFIDPFQGQKMADYAVNRLNAKTAAVFFQTGSDYSEGLKNAFVEEAEKLGLEIVAEEAFPEGDKDFKAQMTNIASKDPDVVFAPIYYAEAGLAITAARAAGCDAVFMGGDGFGSVKNYASAEDLEGSVYCSGYAPGTDSVKQFEEDYKAAYNVDEIPNMFAPLAYDAAMLLCEGLKAAEEQGLTAGTDEYKQAVIDAIKNMSGTEGITGSYSFDEYNNPIKPVAIIELTGGDEVYQEMY